MASFSPRKAKHFLDYKKCSAVELRKFIRDRASTTLSTRDHENLQKAGRLRLTCRLRKMDRDHAFPCFLELPPEIRVAVYECLLIDNRTGDAENGAKGGNLREDGYQIHPAVLRTSRLIYSEAAPILYDKNKFHVKIGWAHAETRPAGNSECHLKVSHPGHRLSFYHKASSYHYFQVMRRFSATSSADMLRALSRLTVDLSLVTGRESIEEYASRARVAVAGLCLTLASARKMKELTFKVELEGNQSSRINIAKVLWPLIFLPKELVVVFEGSSAALLPQVSRSNGTGETQRHCPSSRTQGRFGRMIGEVRHRYKQELEHKGMRHGSLEGIGALLWKLDHLGEWIDMDDVVNSSAKWEALREQSDGMQALMSLERD